MHVKHTFLSHQDNLRRHRLQNIRIVKHVLLLVSVVDVFLSPYKIGLKFDAWENFDHIIPTLIRAINMYLVNTILQTNLNPYALNSKIPIDADDLYAFRSGWRTEQIWPVKTSKLIYIQSWFKRVLPLSSMQCFIFLLYGCYNHYL